MITPGVSTCALSLMHEGARGNHGPYGGKDVDLVIADNGVVGVIMQVIVGISIDKLG